MHLVVQLPVFGNKVTTDMEIKNIHFKKYILNEQVKNCRLTIFFYDTLIYDMVE